MVDDRLSTLTATAAAAEIACGAISSEEYARACLDRIAMTDGDIKAFAHLDREHVLAQARARDERRTERRSLARMIPRSWPRRSAPGAGLGTTPAGLRDCVPPAQSSSARR